MDNWKPIKDFPSYEVSDQGNVRGPKGTLKNHLLNYRYLYVKLVTNEKIRRKDNNKWAFKSVCRGLAKLVAETFIGPCPPNHIVTFKNWKELDCRAVNLKYVTMKERSKAWTNPGERNPAHKLLEEEVIGIRSFKGSHRSMAKKYGVAYGTVRAIRRGEIWK